MSIHLYHRRLYFREGSGSAKNGPLELQLYQSPTMFPGAVEIDFGESHKGDLVFSPFIREDAASRRRDMTAEELLFVRQYLTRLLEAVQLAAKVRCN